MTTLTTINFARCDKIPIYLGGFFSHTGVWISSGVLPAVEMALDHINERPDVLANYELRMVWNDTGVSLLSTRRCILSRQKV